MSAKSPSRNRLPEGGEANSVLAEIEDSVHVLHEAVKEGVSKTARDVKASEDVPVTEEPDVVAETDVLPRKSTNALAGALRDLAKVEAARGRQWREFELTTRRLTSWRRQSRTSRPS